MERQISVFISSSQIELENEREICAEVVHSINLQPILFELSSALSSNPYSAFLKDVENCDIFVLILWKSFSEAVQAEYRKAVEKNKPILVFFKNCTGVEEKAANLKEFIQKINTSSDNAGTIITSYKNFRRLCEFKEELKNALAFEISRFYQEPTCTQSREEMYNLGSDIINYAQKRLIVYQNTPTLILGTKNRKKQEPQQYEDDDSFEIYEKNFQNILEKWIEKYKNIQDAEFIYLFNAKASKEELNACVPSKQKEKKLQEIKNNLWKYKQIEEDTKYRFKITPLDKPVSGPFVIGDNRYGIWIMGGDDAFFFSQENEKFSSALTREVKASCQTVKTCDEIMNSLQF